jgi:pyruvate/2-oxoglutarate dehydrogenase complex dihydrolipoamide dehydrogenase (E3) component
MQPTKAVSAPQVASPTTRLDVDICVIGGGSGGLSVAAGAAAFGRRVVLIEKHKMGGDCLNTGCVPSKALIRTAKFLAHAKRARALGLKSATVEFDFADVMARVQRVIATVEPHDSAARYTDNSPPGSAP